MVSRVVDLCNASDTASVKMTSLLSLCDELLHEVFTLVNPADLAGLARTCRTFNAYIKGNKILWKDAYAAHHVRQAGDLGWQQSILTRNRMIRQSQKVTIGNKSSRILHACNAS